MESYDTTNVFARILRGELPCTWVYQTPYMGIFPDIRPRAAQHFLAIPRGAYRDYSDFMARASAQDIQAFFQGIATFIAERGIPHYSLNMHTGRQGGQDVFHFHVHIMSSHVES